MQKDNGLKAVTENIINQIDKFYNGDSWVTENISKKIFTLDQADAFKKVQGYSHSIAEQVAHMVAWRNFVSGKLLGNTGLDIEDNSKDDWPESEDWDMTREAFKTSQQRLREAIRDFPVDQWNLLVPKRTYTFIFMINGIIEHDYYHYGQIGLVLSAIRKIEE